MTMDASDFIVAEGKEMIENLSGVSLVYEESIASLQNVIGAVKSSSIFQPEVLEKQGIDVPGLVEALGKAIEEIFENMKDDFTLHPIEDEDSFLQDLDVQLTDLSKHSLLLV